jgi:hypothetical protein
MMDYKLFLTSVFLIIGVVIMKNIFYNKWYMLRISLKNFLVAFFFLYGFYGVFSELKNHALN